MKLCPYRNDNCSFTVYKCPENVICPLNLEDNDGKQLNPVLLGPMTFWWKVRVILFIPLWFLSLIDSERATKTWSEYKYGLIKHTCEWDEEHPEKDQFCTWVNCKHYGCSVFKPIKYS